MCHVLFFRLEIGKETVLGSLNPGFFGRTSPFLWRVLRKPPKRARHTRTDRFWGSNGLDQISKPGNSASRFVKFSCFLARLALVGWNTFYGRGEDPSSTFTRHHILDVRGYVVWVPHLPNASVHKSVVNGTILLSHCYSSASDFLIALKLWAKPVDQTLQHYQIMYLAKNKLLTKTSDQAYGQILVNGVQSSDLRFWPTALFLAVGNNGDWWDFISIKQLCS